MMGYSGTVVHDFVLQSKIHIKPPDLYLHPSINSSKTSTTLISRHFTFVKQPLIQLFRHYTVSFELVYQFNNFNTSFNVAL